MSDKSIIITGFPRSGNTWLCRLFSDIFDSPIRGVGPSAHPIGEDFYTHYGRYTIYQEHLLPTYEPYSNELFLPDRKINLCRYNNEHIFHMLRDPRDVAVSAMFYFGFKNLEEALGVMLNKKGYRNMKMGRWIDYVDLWDSKNMPVRTVCYNVLQRYPLKTFTSLVHSIDKSIPRALIRETIRRQSFDTIKSRIANESDGPNYKRTYSKGIQLNALRVGKSGDWRNHFTREEGRMFQESKLGEYILKLGFETSGDWFNELSK